MIEFTSKLLPCRDLIFRCCAYGLSRNDLNSDFCGFVGLLPASEDFSKSSASEIVFPGLIEFVMIVEVLSDFLVAYLLWRCFLYGFLILPIVVATVVTIVAVLLTSIIHMYIC